MKGDRQEETGYRLGIHRPVDKKNGVQFTVSVQSTDQKYPIRPEEVWLEITPLTRGLQDSTASYLFYDPQYKPDMPVPVLSWLADGWPKDADKAQVRFWCKPAGEKSKSINLPLGSMLNKLPKNQVGWTNSELPDISLQVKGRASTKNGKKIYQLAVIEQHTKKRDFQPLKIELTARADRVIRRFDAKLQVVTHTFYFSNVDEKTIATGNVKITTRDDAHSKAWRLEDAMTIDIVNTDDVIQPTNK